MPIPTFKDSVRRTVFIIIRLKMWTIVKNASMQDLVVDNDTETAEENSFPTPPTSAT